MTAAPTDFIDVIRGERPIAAPPTTEATDRARGALLAHVRSAPNPQRGPRRLRRSRRIALGVGAAAASVALVLGVGPWLAGSTDQAEAAPLVKLSAQVVQLAPRPGDATLIERTQSYPDGTGTNGFDLYLDDGTYFYADTVDGLPAALASPDGGNKFVARDEAAALAALDLDPAAARRRMADAALDPAIAAMTREERAATAQPKIAAKKAAGQTVRTMSPEEKEDGDVWSNSIDALIAGASRPDVRAGVLKLLGTVKTVSVTTGAESGRSVLRARASVFGDGYEEELVLDADTGVPLRLTGGYPGETPSVVVTYEVSRVDTSTVG